MSIVRGKPTFKTIDSTINFLGGADGKSKNQESMSYRGANTDMAVSDFMGVSKAIINSVLFCHQEDSSWPLDEAKKLKEKFDAIFGITEYNKALDKIIKLRKTASEELKVMGKMLKKKNKNPIRLYHSNIYFSEASMKLLAHLKKEMDDKSLGLEKAEQKCKDIKEQCAKCDEEVQPIDARLQEIRNIELEISKYHAQKVEMDTK